MATVTALADRVCAVSGLASTSTDRTKVLEYLNEAYQTTVLEAGGYIGTFSKSLTSGTADYTIGTAPLDVSDLSEIRALWISDGSTTDRPLKRIPEYEMVQLRQATAVPSSLPLYYAMRGTAGLLLYPTPGTGTTLKGSYLKAPLVLVESSPVAGTSESTPTAFPAAFHYPALASKAIQLALEYDNRFEEAANYEAKWGNAMERLMAWTTRMGGPTISTVADLGYEGPRDMDRI
jgi:hypothetical protein